MRAGDARVLLTGAHGGIGRAVADRLMAAGASLLLSGRSPARLAAASRELEARHGGAARLGWHACDLTDAAGIAALSQAGQRFGCNVLIHAAGAPAFGPLGSIDADVMAHALHLNLLAPMQLTQALLPHLLEQSRAQIICVGSVLGRIGLPGYSVYSAAKFGLRGFAEALRRELRNTSVRVQYLGPRSTRTSFNDAAVLEYNRRTGTAMDGAEAVAQALLRLLEDERAERFLGHPEAWAARLNGFAPALLDPAFDKHCLAANACIAAGRHDHPTSAQADAPVRS